MEDKDRIGECLFFFYAADDKPHSLLKLQRGLDGLTKIDLLLVAHVIELPIAKEGGLCPP